MKIGIVVPFYNGHQYINRLVKSFDKAAETFDCTLYIIDNSPINQPIEVANLLNLKMEVIREKPGIGYGKASNRGYEICKELGFEYIIIANQDGYVSDSFIQDIILPFQQDSNILISAPLLKVYDNKKIEDFFLKYYITQVPELVTDLMDGTERAYYNMRLISGACFAFKLNSRQYIYPYFFDPLFHMYYEDEDLCYRVKQVKGKIALVCPKAVFYHQHSHTTDTENQERIMADKLVSEKILRLKNISKSSLKSLYGIFVSTITSFTYHIFRGELKNTYLHVRAFVIILYKLPSILKSRRQDLSCIKMSANGTVN